MIEEFSLDKEFDEEIDLTPLIDVVFILLIFFFITSTFIRPSVPVNLAQAASAEATAEQRERMVLAIDAAGVMYYEGAALERSGLPALFREHPQRAVSLMVDRAAPFDAFLAVVDEARLQGRDDLAITTLPDRRE